MSASFSRKLFAGFVLLASLSLASCGEFRTVRYRLTLEVQTPEGKRTGTGVIQNENEYNEGLFRNMGNAIFPAVRGEAVVVDLGERGLLFCLLTGDPTRRDSPTDPGYLISHNFKQYVGDGGPEFYDTLNRDKPKAIVSAAALPLLVRFRDINHPDTVERVNPNDLAASFGQDVKLLRATLEITADAVTTGIETRLPPWFATLRKKRASLSGDTSSVIRSGDSLSNILGTGYFKTEPDRITLATIFRYFSR